MIGKQAQTPVWGGRSGCYTSVGAGGGDLNPALQQPVAQALWTLVYYVVPDRAGRLGAGAVGSNAQSIVAGKDLEIEGAIENTKHQMTRQVVTNGDGDRRRRGARTASATR